MIAILYTGEIRTMPSVIDTFIKNVLVNENHHVHAVLQSPKPNDDVYKLGNHLKSLQWFNPHDITWLYVKSVMANNMRLHPKWYYYIVHGSGSMVEYYQMYWAYLQMVAYERKYGIKYDYVFRIRCDCVITRPFNYDWMHYKKEDINNKLNLIDTNKNCVFMNSLLDPDRYLIRSDITISGNDKDVHEVLEGNYFLITFRENVMYFGSRAVFENLHLLGINYGCIKSNDEFWCNSESQLRLFCQYYGIDIYDSSTKKEDASLYKYNKNNYYHDNTLIDQQDVLFFLKRM